MKGNCYERIEFRVTRLDAWLPSTSNFLCYRKTAASLRIYSLSTLRTKMQPHIGGASRKTLYVISIS
jgi:hypothetical protein